MQIIATIGHQSFSEDMVRKIILGGADVLRYNLSYKVIRENIDYIKVAQKMADDLNATTKIMLDFPMNKIRLGDFETKIYSVRENDEIILKSAPYSPDCHEFVPVDTHRLSEKVNVGQTITIGDGQVLVQVLEILDTDTIVARVLNSGIINYMKTFNFKHRMEKEDLLNLYDECLRITSEINPNYISISYIDEGTNEQIKQMIAARKISAKVMIKIERSLSEYEIENLCQDHFYSMIIIDRGEIAVNMPFERLGTYQKEIFSIAKKYKKPVLVATQILESAMFDFIPTRAEILDLTNMIIDGAEGIVLGRETASTTRPMYALAAARKIITEAEKFKNKFQSQPQNN